MGIRQQRRTHIDTIEFQQKMFQFMKEKMESDVKYIEDGKESYEFFILLSNALLGQGPISKIVPVYEGKGVRIPMGSDVHHFALQLMNLRSNKVKVRHQGREYILGMEELWSLLWKYCLILFPRAQTEALHMSKEEWKRQKRTAGYTFNPEKKL